MSEQDLYGAQVGASFEHVSGEAVPESVGETRFWMPARLAA
jgi:hypothetical protein